MRVIDLALDLAEEAFLVTSRMRRLPVGLASQMQRAAVSIGSNISEGCGRSTDPQFLAFLQIAMGSACELDFQIRVAQRCAAGTPAFERLEELTTSVRRMLVKLSGAVEHGMQERGGE